MFYLPHIYHRTQSVFPSVTDWLTSVGTISVAVLAIWGERVRMFFMGSKLSFIEIKISPQRIGGRELKMYRLVLKNSGKTMARDVRASVTKNSNIDQQRFIPFPLNWTHINGRKRSISCDEEAYLDLFQKTIAGTYVWYWPRAEAPEEYALSNLSTRGISTIQINFHEESSYLGSVELEFNPVTETCEIL